MFRWELTQGMPLQPNCCIACGSTPIDDEGVPDAAAWATGIDVNWGDSVYLCRTCVRVAAGLFGMMTDDEAEKMREELQGLREEHSELEREHAKLSAFVGRMRDGAQAKKQAKEMVTK
jgi:hypothetical protein